MPTAVQLVGAEQATASSSLVVPGLGAATIAHDDPFHRCASVREPPDEGTTLPTAVQDVDDAHTIPLNTEFPPPEGAGTVWIDHDVP